MISDVIEYDPRVAFALLMPCEDGFRVEMVLNATEPQVGMHLSELEVNDLECHYMVIPDAKVDFNYSIPSLFRLEVHHV